MSEPSAAPQMARDNLVGSCARGDGAGRERISLLQSSLGLVENVRRHSDAVPLPWPGPERFSPDFRICLPYRGLLVVHVGGDVVVGDASQVLFNSRGLAYRLGEPVAGGYAELCITPTRALLAELLDIPAAELPTHALFRRRCRRADVHLQLLRARFLHRANSGTWDSLAAEELLVAILRCALACDRPVRLPSRSTRRLIGRTKEFVECHLTESFRLSDVARAVGASPAYLTDAFRRFEGLPLHRYTLQSRLARALVELPHADDLTRLALDLGFSSHSHFAAAFRRTFGCTPSAFRASTRGCQQRRQAQLALQNDPSLICR